MYSNNNNNNNNDNVYGTITNTHKPIQGRRTKQHCRTFAGNSRAVAAEENPSVAPVLLDRPPV